MSKYQCGQVCNPDKSVMITLFPKSAQTDIFVPYFESMNGVFQSLFLEATD